MISPCTAPAGVDRNDIGTHVLHPDSALLANALVRRMLAATVVCLAPAVLPQMASAHQNQDWMPRRHFRSMKEAREAPTFEVSRSSPLQPA